MHMVVHDPGLFIVYLRMCVGFEDAPVQIPPGIVLCCVSK